MTHSNAKNLAKTIQKIYQKNNHEFTILWSDGLQADYRLSDLQDQCPCANCVDEISGKRLPRTTPSDPKTQAIRLKNVGRYALKIEFASGCSSGIYGFDMLYDLAKKGLS